MPLEKGCTTKSLWKRAPKPPKQNKSLWKRAAPQKAFGKGHKSKTRAFGKGPQAFEKGFKTLGKSFNPVSPAEPLEKGSKLLEKSLNSVSPAKCTETSRPTSGQLEKNNQLMKNSENEI